MGRGEGGRVARGEKREEIRGKRYQSIGLNYIEVGSLLPGVKEVNKFQQNNFCLENTTISKLPRFEKFFEKYPSKVSQITMKMARTTTHASTLTTTSTLMMTTNADHHTMLKREKSQKRTYNRITK